MRKDRLNKQTVDDIADKIIRTMSSPAVQKRLLVFGIAKKIAFAAFFAFSLYASPAGAAEYSVDTKASKITFSGTHADNPFSGSFGEWTALVTFDPADLGASKIVATFNTASAKTGNSMYDGTLPQADWFDVKTHPQATFTTTAITAKPDGSGYSAAGDLTIRGITKPVQFDFTLSDLAQSPVTAKGSFTLNRLDFDIGKKSDAPAEWVGRDITVSIDITATPKP